MAQTTASAPDMRRIFIELRTGDVLEVGGVRIQLEYKKGQAARMVIAAEPETCVRKIAAASRPVPSLPS
ncbi:hypothetical protein DR66_2778 [Delftia acidovorans]|uniref:hypothetical protein n=1 Tax=Delftia acidovorans TaxID=80866 RepID=UPI0005059399|nr:hypothetical protein [Delftia acidovorans]KFJ11518.1 hypothetical protein DR66_2778 [Delftia acidovorans]QQB52965.1 hypothetical protein I6H54_12150 [Delftia acidovorans]